MTTEKTPLFLLGVGFIGGSILQSLLDSRQYAITALTRSDEKAERLKELGVKPLKGSLDDHELIRKATLENDVVIHAATADDLPSVKAILQGLSERPSSAKRATYIHTSGTGVLTATPSEDIVYSDKEPEKINEKIPDSADHRLIDLEIKRAVEGNKVGGAHVAIILPPLIYGIGTGPFNTTSIQVPGWIRASIEDKVVTLTPNHHYIWHHIHVANLVAAYRTLLDHILLHAPPSLYYFAETGSHQWKAIGDQLQQLLSARGLIEATDFKIAETPNDPRLKETQTVSRCKAEWLREWGWEGQGATKLGLHESIEQELDVILKKEYNK